MPYLSGVLTGILLTILVVFLIDHVGDEPASRDIVNWDVVSTKLGAASDQVRQEVHEATEPTTDDTAATPQTDTAQ